MRQAEDGTALDQDLLYLFLTPTMSPFSPTLRFFVLLHPSQSPLSLLLVKT